jgi:structural maintenance of chromosome 4
VFFQTLFVVGRWQFEKHHPFTTTEKKMSAAATMEETVSTQSPKRLMIAKLVLENFKSYAGVKEIGPFHKCFSSIVGANGSGKSNVIDAMLFVFGKRAKKLRLNKVSELIHNSAEHPDCTYAKVSVYFTEIIDTDEGDNGYEVVEGSESVVSRTAYKGNTSKYEVDGVTKTFKEVAVILRARGIDLDHNRFLILQGEVEQISLMKPKAQTEHEEGLLEYLEDIIGSNKYVEQIKEESLKVDTLCEQRSERLNRAKMAEREVTALEGPRGEAMAYLTKVKELHEAKSAVFQRKSYDCTKTSKEVLFQTLTL